MGHCSRHGDYGGGATCYLCAEDERRHFELLDAQDRAARAYQTNREEQAKSAREAADRQTDAVANAWRLRADSMTARAADLITAELFLDAQALCERAIIEDPGNLRARVLLAVANNALGDVPNTKQAMLSALKLLGRGEWSGASALSYTMRWVTNRKIEGDFVDQLRMSVRDFAASDSKVTSEVIEETLRREWPEETALLVARSDDPYEPLRAMFKIGWHSAARHATEAITERVLTSSVPTLSGWQRAVSCELIAYDWTAVWSGERLFHAPLLNANRELETWLQAIHADKAWRSDGKDWASFLSACLTSRVLQRLNETESRTVSMALQARQRPPLVQKVLTRLRIDLDAGVRWEAVSKARRVAADILASTGVQRFTAVRQGDSEPWTADTSAIRQVRTDVHSGVKYWQGARSLEKKLAAEAVSHFSEAAGGFEDIGNELWLGYAYRELGWALCPDRNPSGSWTEAASAFNRAAANSRSSKTVRTYAQAMYGKAWCSEPLNTPNGSWENCIALYRAAGRFASEAADDVQLAEAVHAQAWCYEKSEPPLQDFGKAAELYDGAILIWEKLQRNADIARSAFNRARCLSKNDKSRTTPEARALFERVAAIRSGLGDESGARDAMDWVQVESHVSAPA
jgi:hypothetical protein